VPDDATPDVIRAALVETEDVDDLAKNIAKTDGNMAGERIIVVEEGGTYLVLEGNRRTCACQLLLNPSLIPSKSKTRFPAISGGTRDAIEKLAADIAPSREAAEPVITRRHIEVGIKPWNTVAKHRRIRRLLAAGRNLQTISAEFGQTVGSLRKTLREMALIDKVRAFENWTTEEKAALSDPQLKTNAFTRFFTLEGVKPALALSFNEDGQVESELDKRDLNTALQFIARKLLIPAGSDSDKAPTRMTPADIWKEFASLHRTTAKKLKVSKSMLTGRGRTKLKGKSASFFESLECPVKDDQLRQLTKEISTINHAEFPTAATFLLRALIERSLDYAITKAGLDKQLHKEWHTKRKQHTTDPGLDFIMAFAISHAPNIFRGAVAKVLSHWQGTKKFSDMVIHGKWVNAHPTTLEEVAGFVRPLVQKILNGTALK